MPVRTVISIGDARLCAIGVENEGRSWNEGLVAPELGSLSNSWIGTFVEGSEREKKRDQAGVGSGRKSLTSVLIFHADLQSEKFSLRFLQ